MQNCSMLRWECVQCHKLIQHPESKRKCHLGAIRVHKHRGCRRTPTANNVCAGNKFVISAAQEEELKCLLTDTGESDRCKQVLQKRLEQDDVKPSLARDVANMSKILRSLRL